MEGAHRARGAADLPWVTWTLAGLILLVAWQVTGFAPTPATIEPVAWSTAAWRAGQLDKLVTSMFAHGGLLHLGFNLLALLGIGATLERSVGHVKFALVYFGAGLLGNFAHATYSQVPVVGASGALYGLVGLIAVLAPRTEIALLLPVPMSAVLAGAIYVATVPFMLAYVAVLPIAHVAHLGGMAFGMAASFAVHPRRALRTSPAVGAIFLLVWVGTAQLAAALTQVLRGPPPTDVDYRNWALAGGAILAAIAVAMWYLARVDAEDEAGAPAEPADRWDAAP